MRAPEDRLNSSSHAQRKASAVPKAGKGVKPWEAAQKEERRMEGQRKMRKEKK